MTHLQQLRECMVGLYDTVKGNANRVDVPMPGPQWCPVAIPGANGALHWKRVAGFDGQGTAVILHAEETSVVPLHYHDGDEIVLCCIGEILLVVEGRRTLLREGDVAMINAREAHNAEFTKGSRVLVWWPNCEDRNTLTLHTFQRSNTP